MLVWRFNLAWKSGDPNQCLRLGDDAKTDRALRARFRGSASYGNALKVLVNLEFSQETDEIHNSVFGSARAAK